MTSESDLHIHMDVRTHTHVHKNKKQFPCGWFVADFGARADRVAFMGNLGTALDTWD